MLEGSGKPTGGGGCVNSGSTLSFVEQNVTFDQHPATNAPMLIALSNEQRIVAQCNLAQGAHTRFNACPP